ncbi:MAG: dihydroneopterin aldolase [Proteobacteria bacterium]|nr:dihydroneopterin aldolase [Pseudomonadota bacterium]
MSRTNDARTGINEPYPAEVEAASGVRHVFVRDLELGAKIGVHTFERVTTQPVRINVDLFVGDDGSRSDQLADFVCYEEVVDGIKRIIADGHVNLVETLADNIADMCLSDQRVLKCRIRVEKLKIIAEASSVGVEIERTRST